jgi:carbonic anhydrase
MSIKESVRGLLDDLAKGNASYVNKFKHEIQQHDKDQQPKVAILTCADSRVIPEYIFSKSLGELFVVRVAGNIACDPTVIASLEYAVGHLHVPLLLILGHSHCGAVWAAKHSTDDDNPLVHEIAQGFPLHENSVLGNLKRQLSLLPQRSQVIADAIRKGELHLQAAVYDLEKGTVNFVE